MNFHNVAHNCKKERFSISTAIASICCDLIPLLGFLLAAIHLHKRLLHGVIRAPLQFYDQTPVGRILSRFSKDVDVIDTGLPHQINGLIYCFHEVIRVVAVVRAT